MSRDSSEKMLPVKDESKELPIPAAWRPVFREIVAAFVRHDYGLSATVPGVAPISADTAAHIENYIKRYGATLLELPDDTWNTSVYIWQGHHWDALVDL